MYYLLMRPPEMEGRFEFHPGGRFHARLEGVSHTVCNDCPDWNPFLVRQQDPVMGLQLMTEVQRSWDRENWCLTHNFKPDFQADSYCRLLLQGILGTQMPAGIEQMGQLDLKPLLGSYCQVRIRRHRPNANSIIMVLEDFTPVKTTLMVEFLFPLFAARVCPDQEIMGEMRRLSYLEEDQVLQV